MAYLSPIPKRRDRKGTGTARVLALLGRTYLAYRVAKEANKKESEKKAAEEEAKRYKRGREAAQDLRAEQSLEIQQKNYERGVSKDEYQRERDAISDLYKQADLADKQGDNARADEYLKLAKQREARMRAADERSAAKGSGGGSGENATDRLRSEWIDNFNSNYGMLPAGLDTRIKTLVQGKTAGEAGDALSRAFFGGEGDAEGNTKFYQPIPKNVLADPDVLNAMFDRLARMKNEYGIVGDVAKSKSAFFEAFKLLPEAAMLTFGKHPDEQPHTYFEDQPSETEGSFNEDFNSYIGE